MLGAKFVLYRRSVLLIRSSSHSGQRRTPTASALSFPALKDGACRAFWSSEELFNEQEECNHARKVEVGAMVFVRSLSAGRLKPMSRLRSPWSPLPGASPAAVQIEQKKRGEFFAPFMPLHRGPKTPGRQTR